MPKDTKLPRRWLKRAEYLTKFEHLEGGSWHPFRCAWATTRKDCSLVDVAAAGGWKSVQTLLRCYVQPDEATMIAVVNFPLNKAGTSSDKHLNA